MRRLATVAALIVLAGSFAPATLAQGKGKGRKDAAPVVYGITLEVVFSADENNAGPTHGDSVKFNVSGTATTPFVSLVCHQGTTMVYALGGYPADHVFLLSSQAWTSGAAECTATVYTGADGSSSKTTTVGTLTFQVGA
jgi:hypothetical protein